MRDFSIHIRGREWRVCFVGTKQLRDSWGEADHPSVRRPRIFVHRGMDERNLTSTLIHEVLHAVRPELCEEAVDETATILERALHRSGVGARINRSSKSVAGGVARCQRRKTRRKSGRR